MTNRQSCLSHKCLIETTLEGKKLKLIRILEIELKNWKVRLKLTIKEGKRLSIKSSCSIFESIRKSFLNGIAKSKKIEKKLQTRQSLMSISRKNKNKWFKIKRPKKDWMPWSNTICKSISVSLSSKRTTKLKNFWLKPTNFWSNLERKF